ncbi:hypothetical protein LCGC14_2250360 [marine sediment metagenome]|uniref:Uncharacterized protein n=1 Tax=marine sediment metagenome TaxID=412755 RepID=A0A0F9D2J5_9ZZZZ
MSSIPETARQVIEWLRQNDPEFMREYLREAVQDAELGDELRPDFIEFPPAPLPDESRDVPILLADGRFKIDATDSDADFFETKITDGTTVRGTKIAGDWEETGDDGTKKIRQVFVPVDELQNEIGDQTGASMSQTFAYRSHLFGSQTVQINAADWRNRIVFYRYAWDNEPTAQQWPNIREGQTYWIDIASGHLTLFTADMGGDTCEVWVDGDNSGVLKVTSVNNGNFGDIITWITASGIGSNPS